MYRVTAISASTLTLANGSVIFAEGPESIGIGRGRAPTIADIKISQVNAFKVNAGGNIDIEAGKSVYLDSDTTIRLDQVIAGKAENYGDNVRIATIGQTGESILDGTVSSEANIEGQNLILEAATGTIGGTGGAAPITIDLVSHGTLTARAQGDVSISAINGALTNDNAGTMYLQHVFSANGNAYLTAYDSILDPFANTSTVGKAVQINAHHITLNALNGSIGNVVSGQPDFIAITADQTFAGSVDATAHGSIYLFETDLNLHVHQVLSQAGDVNLQAALSIYDQASQNLNVVTDNPVTDIFGNNITLTALFGGIGLAGDPLDIYSHYAFDQGASATVGTLTSTTLHELGLNTYIIQKSNSSLPDPNNLYLNTVTTGTNEVAFITAPSGSILNGSSGGPNVLGGNTLLFARDNIGASAKHITTEVGNLEAQSTTGSTWIDNNGNLAIGGTLISSSAIGVHTGGSATITASSPITVKKSAISGDSLLYVAVNDEPGLDNLFVSALDLNGDPLFLKAVNNITLIAGDNLTVQGPTGPATQGALLQAGGAIFIKGDTSALEDGTPAADTDPAATTITIAGTVQAPTIEIDGGQDQDTIKTTGTLIAAFPWTAATWPFATVGASFPASHSTASQITINGGGGDDQVLLWGNVAAKETAINGGAGDDYLALNPDNLGGNTLAISGRIVMNGGTGDDQLIVNKLNTLDLAHKFLNGSGTPASVVTGHETSVPASAPRDMVWLDGQGGSDDYTLNLTGTSDYIANVHDSGAPANGIDTLTINGTPDQGNVFLMRTQFVARMQPIGDPANGNYGANYQRINYDSSINLLDVNGGSGADYFYVDDNSAITVLDGAAGEDHFQFGR